MMKIIMAMAFGFWISREVFQRQMKRRLQIQQKVNVRRLKATLIALNIPEEQRKKLLQQIKTDHGRN